MFREAASEGHKSHRAAGRPEGFDKSFNVHVKDLTDPTAKKLSVPVKPWSTVKDVKELISQRWDVPFGRQILYFKDRVPLRNNHKLVDATGIVRSGETLLLDIVAPGGTPSAMTPSQQSSTIFCHPDFESSCSPALFPILEKVRRGHLQGLKPVPTKDGDGSSLGGGGGGGCGGSYFLRNRYKANLGVFKPADEEAYAEHNPNNYTDGFMRKGIKPGTSYLREMAAYLLDHRGFSCVPQTAIVLAQHPAYNYNGAQQTVGGGGAARGAHSGAPTSNEFYLKIGSFQEFIKHDGSMDNYGSSKIPVDEVHKIAILDLRIMNSDRNSSNLFVRKRPTNMSSRRSSSSSRSPHPGDTPSTDHSLELVPIDHGLCLRSHIDINSIDWVWFEMKQLSQPLSAKSRQYVLSLDVEKDAKILSQKLGFSQDVVDLFRASNALLIAGVRAGLTLRDIAELCLRSDDIYDPSPSRLEVLVRRAKDLSSKSVDNGKWSHVKASKALMDCGRATHLQHQHSIPGAARTDALYSAPQLQLSAKSKVATIASLTTISSPKEVQTGAQVGCSVAASGSTTPSPSSVAAQIEPRTENASFDVTASAIITATTTRSLEDAPLASPPLESTLSSSSSASEEVKFIMMGAGSPLIPPDSDLNGDSDGDGFSSDESELIRRHEISNVESSLLATSTSPDGLATVDSDGSSDSNDLSASESGPGASSRRMISPICAEVFAASAQPPLSVFSLEAERVLAWQPTLDDEIETKKWAETEFGHTVASPILSPVKGEGFPKALPKLSSPSRRVGKATLEVQIPGSAGRVKRSDSASSYGSADGTSPRDTRRESAVSSPPGLGWTKHPTQGRWKPQGSRRKGSFSSSGSSPQYDSDTTDDSSTLSSPRRTGATGCGAEYSSEDGSPIWRSSKVFDDFAPPFQLEESKWSDKEERNGGKTRTFSAAINSSIKLKKSNSSSALPELGADTPPGEGGVANDRQEDEENKSQDDEEKNPDSDKSNALRSYYYNQFVGLLVEGLVAKALGGKDKKGP